MAGEEVLDKLRRDPATIHVPVIVLSADATAHSREQLMKRGADAYVSKPFQVSSLLELLDDTLRKNWHDFLKPSETTRHSLLLMSAMRTYRDISKRVFHRLIEFSHKRCYRFIQAGCDCINACIGKLAEKRGGKILVDVG